jgi:exodeoxyribonuclease VII large subunit
VNAAAFEEGVELTVRGYASIYKPKGRLSFVVQEVERGDVGNLKKEYDLLKAKLEAEGLFTRKRDLPKNIRRIGVITSRTGAVIDDFRRNLAPRGLEVCLYDVRVEGKRAVDEITTALEYFRAHSDAFDVIAIMRGGGSLEDMIAFNNETVARALFSMPVPTIAGIGHDRDVSICAMVADVATSTPSFAAVRVNDSWVELESYVALAGHRITRGLERNLADMDARVQNAVATISGYSSRLITGADSMRARLLAGAGQMIEHACSRIKECERYLAAADPERPLKLGYSILFNEAGKVLKSTDAVREGDRVTSRLADGSFSARVETITKNKKA